jgi:hypothetical protein
MGDNEQDSKPGGQSAARNFLWGVIPMFCWTVFQDGIYWIEDKPEHPISLFIIGCLGEQYRDWAREERDRIAHLEIAEADEQINRLDPQSKAAFDRMHEVINIQFAELKEREREREHHEREREIREREKEHREQEHKRQF